MARTFKQPPRQNLLKIPVLIEDTKFYSEYFEVAELNRIFHAGKNGFLIRGSSFLKQNTGISIEVLDRFDNSVFTTPVDGFSEAGSRLVSVEIFQKTQRGPGKLIILGTADTYADGRSIPLNFREKPNVRWVIPIQIEPQNQNTTTIRLANTPTAAVSERNFATTRFDTTTILDNTYTASLQYDYETQKSDGYAINMLSNAGAPVTFFDTVNVDGIFTGSLYKRVIESSSAGTIQVLSDYTTASVSMSLDKVLNRTTAISNTPIIFGDKTDYFNPILKSGSFERVIQNSVDDNGTTRRTIEEYTSSVVFEYVSESIAHTVNTSSIINFRIPFVQTSTGEIAKVKISAKEANTAITSFQPFTEFVPGERNLIISSSTLRGDTPAGVFTERHILDNNWFGALFNKTDGTFNQSEYDNNVSATYPVTLVTSSDFILEGIRVDHTSSASNVPYFIGTKNHYQLYNDIEYTLKYTAIYTPNYVTSSAGTAVATYSTADTGSLKTFLTRIGSTTVLKNSSSISNNDRTESTAVGHVSKYGLLVDSFRTETNDKSLYEREVNFKVPRDGVARLRLKPESGFWHFGNIEITPAVERGFHPDEIIFDAENNILVNSTNVFKIQFLNFRDEPIDYEIITSPLFVSGSRLAKIMNLTANRSVFTFDTDGDADPAGQTTTVDLTTTNILSDTVWTVVSDSSHADDDGIVATTGNVAGPSAVNYTTSNNTFVLNIGAFGFQSQSAAAVSAGITSSLQQTSSILITATADGVSDKVRVGRIRESATGPAGAQGDDAVANAVTANSLVFVKARAGALSPSSITITANTQNTTTDGVWSNVGGTRTSTDNTIDGNGVASCTVSSSDFADGMVLTYTLDSDDGSIASSVTLKLVDEGVGPITAQLGNESHALPASAAGAVSSYAGSGTTIRVYEGTTELTFVTGTPAAGQWAVAVGNTANITEGGVTDSGDYATIGNHSGAADGTDEYAINYTISGKTERGTTFSSFVKTQTLTKVKDGYGLTITLSRPSKTFTAAANGAVSDHSDSGTTITVKENGTAIVYDGAGSGAGTFTIAPVESQTSATDDITVGSLTDSGDYVTVGDHTGFVTAVDSATITYTVSGKHFDGTAFSETAVQSFSKSKIGATGPQGDSGAGALGPGVVYRGVYAAGTTYFATSVRKDIVKYGGTYWVTSTEQGASSFSGQTPSENTYWDAFGAEFDSVATDILLAQQATITQGLVMGSLDYFTDATCDYNNDPTITHDANSLIVPGLGVSGTGIPAGAYVDSINSTTSFELSVSTTGGSVTNGTLQFNPSAFIRSADATTLTSGNGFWMDTSGSFRVGNPSAGHLKWDAGTTTATVGGWTLGSTLSAGSSGTYILLDPGNSKVRIGAKTSLTDGNTGVHLGSDGLALGASSVFKVTAAGVLTATSATLTGTVTATAGQIGGWTINGDKIQSNNAYLRINGRDDDPKITIGSHTIGDGPGIQMGYDSSTSTLQFFAGQSASDYIKYVAGTGVDIKTAKFKIDTSTFDVDTAGGGSIALGATPNTGVAGTNKGVYMDGGGDFLVYGNASNYFKFDASATSIDIKTDTLLLDATTLYLDSATPSLRFAADASGLSYNGTGIFLGKDGSYYKMSLKSASGDSLTWDGNGTLTITGNITADGGTIGGWAVGSTLSATNILLDPSTPKITLGSKATLTDSNTGFYAGTDGIALGASSVFKVTAAGAVTAANLTITGGSLSVGSSNNIFRVDTDGDMWIGHATQGSAPFQVTKAGAVTASNLTVTGGSLSVGSSNNIFRVDTDGDMWIGHATQGSAPFQVSKAGALIATSATITGDIRATTGTFSGTVTCNSLTLNDPSGNSSLVGFGTVSNLTTIGVDQIDLHRDGITHAQTIEIEGGAVAGNGINSTHLWIDSTLSVEPDDDPIERVGESGTESGGTGGTDMNDYVFYVKSAQASKFVGNVRIIGTLHADSYTGVTAGSATTITVTNNTVENNEHWMTFQTYDAGAAGGVYGIEVDGTGGPTFNPNANRITVGHASSPSGNNVGNSDQWTTAYKWGDHGLSSQDKTDISNLSGTNSGDTAVTDSTSTTSSSTRASATAVKSAYDRGSTGVSNAASAQSTANAALPKSGGAMTGAITTNSTFDGIDIATRDGVLTSTTTTANAALSRGGGTMTGTIAAFRSTGIDDNADALAITIDSAENVGMRVTNPEAYLHVYGSNSGASPAGGSIVFFEGSGNAWISLGSPNDRESGILFADPDHSYPGQFYYNHATNAFHFNVAGGNHGSGDGMIISSAANVTATDFIADSDIRLKNVTGGVSNALSTVNKLNAIRYTWKDKEDDREQIGFSAQEVLELVPEAVYGSEETEYGISYGKLVPVLVEAIKELTAEVEALKKKVGE